MKDELIGGHDSIVNFTVNSHASLFLSRGKLKLTLWIRFFVVLPTFAALNMAPRALRLVCLACFYGWLTLAASFNKRYPSNVDETLFRFHRSRIQQWQNKCRRQQRIRRSRRESVALSSASSNRRTRTSGTRLFWGKPSRQSISQRFWDASVPEFNNDNAGDFTNPLLTATSTTSLTESREQETVRLKHDVAVPCSRRGGTNGDNESQGWWPTIPFLGLVGMRLKGPFVHRPLVVEGCNLLCRYMSGVIMSRRVLCYRLEVGEGLGCYERVRDAALKWEFDSGDEGIQAVPSDPPRTGSSQQSSWKSVHPLEGTTLSAYRSEARGHRMVSWSRVGPLYVLSPVAVIYECLNQRGTGKDGASTVFTSCAYATQRGHWLSGEERVTVALREVADPLRASPVEVEVVSISKAAPSLMGCLAWPFIGKLQDKFFVEQLRAFKRAAHGQYLNQEASQHEQFCTIKPMFACF